MTPGIVAEGDLSAGAGDTSLCLVILRPQTTYGSAVIKSLALSCQNIQ